MLNALLFGLVASSALVIGAVAGAYWTPPGPLLASALAFASGALITALAFDLFQESFDRGGVWPSAIGLLFGAATFIVADMMLDRYIEGTGGGVSAFPLLAAVTLDGIPENMALGVSLLETTGSGTLTLLVAIFLSNLPEALGGAVGMRQQGRSSSFAIVVWSATAVVLALAVVIGNVAVSGAGEGLLAVLLSFAGGAVLASLADTLMPDAYREGGKWVAFATAAGFLLAFLIAEV
ncbi:MAG: zinc permease [Rubrobacteraceae bacterium]|nr:zinc permease [Rubrobacteraceae bacterium]MBA3615530.1 zinc permease [Rubrobacteraceae bacterium]MDQ3250778.1 zinc permease [Actinomycetota bacterium]MDQ3438674.1 zinc permease [Actinomycetota bacterium]